MNLYLPYPIEFILGGLLLAMPSQKKRETHVLFGMYFIFKALLGVTLLNAEQPFCPPIPLEYIKGFLFMAIDTVLYMGFFSIIFPMKGILRRYGYLFFIAAGLGIFYAYSFAAHSHDEQLKLVECSWHSAQEYETSMLMFYARLLLDVFATLQILYFQFLIIRFGVQFVRFARNNYSYTERFQAKGFIFMEIFILASLIFDSLIVIDYSAFMRVAYLVFELSFAVIVYYLVANDTLFQPQLLASQFADYINDLKPKYLLRFHLSKKKEMLCVKNTDIEERLMRHFFEEKPFLSARLTINDVARSIGSNRSYLSSVLNDDLGETFYHYVNIFRIEEAKSRTIASDLKSKKDLAEEVGFGSYTTFTKYHKLYENKTEDWYQKYRQLVGDNEVEKRKI